MIELNDRSDQRLRTLAHVLKKEFPALEFGRLFADLHGLPWVAVTFNLSGHRCQTAPRPVETVSIDETIATIREIVASASPKEARS